MTYTETIEERQKRLKEEFLKYYSELPNQKLAAGWVGVDEDTIINWKKADPIFSDDVRKAKSQFAMTNVRRVRSKEWLLERIMKDEFAERKEMSGPDGDKLVIEIVEPEKKKYGTTEAGD